jgi:hypothetical protein
LNSKTQKLAVVVSLRMPFVIVTVVEFVNASLPSRLGLQLAVLVVCPRKISMAFDVLTAEIVAVSSITPLAVTVPYCIDFTMLRGSDENSTTQKLTVVLSAVEYLVAVTVVEFVNVIHASRFVLFPVVLCPRKIKAVLLVHTAEMAAVAVVSPTGIVTVPYWIDFTTPGKSGIHGVPPSPLEILRSTLRY